MRKAYEIRVSRLHETPCVDRLDTPAIAAAYWRETIAKMPWFDPDREQCVSVVLNTRYAPVGHSLVSIGTLNETTYHCREVFRAAIALNAYAVLVMHNHPSGQPSPSDADQRMTRRLAEAGRCIAIDVKDHVIIGGVATPYFSFREAGLL